MARPLLPDGLWALIEPLLPPRPAPRGGRPRLPDRAALTGVLVRAQDRAAVGGPAGRDGVRVRDDLLAAAGRVAGGRDVGRIHAVLLERLAGAGRLDWSRLVADSSSVRAVFGGVDTGRNPADRWKRGSKHHLITDGRGAPLAALVSGADVPDLGRLLPLVLAVPLGLGPTPWPPELLADRGYDSEWHRAALRRLGVEPHIGRRAGADAPPPAGAVGGRADGGHRPPQPAAEGAVREAGGRALGVPHPGLHQSLLVSPRSGPELSFVRVSRAFTS